MQERYRSYNSYMREIFGEKVYKLSVDGGMTCPNRDGTVGTRGCTFCSGGSGAFAEFGSDINAQLDNAKKRVSAKFSGSRYIAYYQSYTNTYAPLDYLKKIYSPAVSRSDIAGIAIGTRPDCLSGEIIEYIASINRIKPVFIELGLQTVHPATAEAIRRGYPLSVYDDAVRRLGENNINTVVHLILGLPGETREMMLDSVRYVAGSGVDGIKLQLLHILKGTDMAEEYYKGRVPVMDMHEYIRLIADCVSILPKHIVIHRLTGDGDKRELIAPVWSADKKRVLNAMRRYFDEHDIIQGSGLIL